MPIYNGVTCRNIINFLIKVDSYSETNLTLSSVGSTRDAKGISLILANTMQYIQRCPKVMYKLFNFRINFDKII